MKILIIDNYDSFTYNLFHLVEQFPGTEVEVFRNDVIEVADAERYDRIIISPGPGVPSEAGITNAVLKKYFQVKPILGVCLGMQAMAEVAGGKLKNMAEVFHGVAMRTLIVDKSEKLFKGITNEFASGRYHSWCVERESLPSDFHITAEDEFGNIMSMTHKNQLFRGVQFHPESVLTEFGNLLMSNWLIHC